MYFDEPRIIPMYPSKNPWDKSPWGKRYDPWVDKIVPTYSEVPKPVNLSKCIENDKGLFITANLAGFTKEDFTVEFDNDYIVIKTSITLPASPGINAKFFCPEHEYDYDNIKSTLNLGILSITVPKLNKKSKKRKIDVN